MKVSREIGLIRTTSARLIEFEKSNGDPVFVNPEDVSFVELRNETSSIIQLKTGKNTIVVGSPAEVAEKLVS